MGIKINQLLFVALLMGITSFTLGIVTMSQMNSGKGVVLGIAYGTCGLILAALCPLIAAKSQTISEIVE